MSSQHKQDKTLKPNSLFKRSENVIRNETITEDNASLNNGKCQFCFKIGHTLENCFLKSAIEKSRSVNFILSEKKSVPTKINIDKQTYMVLIDTGADVSLISDKFVDRFRKN